MNRHLNGGIARLMEKWTTTSPSLNKPSRSGLTRRRFLQGTAALGGAVAAVSILPGCTNSASTDSGGDPTIVDSEDAINVTQTYEDVDLKLTEKNRWSLPVGSVLRPAENTWIPFIAPGEVASTMVVGCALSLTSGEKATVVNKTINTGTNWVIYDVRCSDKVYAWVELETLARDWKLYAQSFSAGTLKDNPTLLWEGDADFDPPRMCCAGEKVIWQVMPALSGSRTTEYSHCYVWEAGSPEAQAVVESPGRFATSPSVSDDLVVLAPRVNPDEGVYYGITAYSLDDNLATIVDRLTLPTSVAPFVATRIGDEFVFSIEANYSSGGLFGNMGTYIGHGDGPFVWLSREPAADVSGTKKGVYLIKTTTSCFVVDTGKETFSVLSAVDNAVDYGEYPARSGETSLFVIFSTVKNKNTGEPSEVVVRTFGT